MRSSKRLVRFGPKLNTIPILAKHDCGWGIMSSRSSNRPRELRRRVNLRARMRANAGWSDAAILNISSRGMMISAPRNSGMGSTVELWLGRQRLVATVVWRNGGNAGLSAQELIPVDELLASDKGQSLRVTAEPWQGQERRARPRGHDESRQSARWMEFCSIGLVAAALSLGALGLVGQAFARPLIKIHQVLG